MTKKTKNPRNVLFTGASIVAAAAALGGTPAMAQDDEAIVVTGTRITVPGVTSSSPIYSVGQDEIQLQGQPEVERIVRLLPVAAVGDNGSVNNGTDGAATLNLRGLGAQRNLVMMDGVRIMPYSISGVVDTQVIPTALIDRIDIVTGGASAVYGSDAMSGAINFVLRDDFEGLEIDVDRSITGDNDGEIRSIWVTMGANLADGRGNAVISANYSERDGVQLGARPLGQLGIETESGANYTNFLNGQLPTAPADPLCQGENAVASGGSTTTTPTRISIAGGLPDATIAQFRTDGSLGANCSVFNFNPYNYYQTPQERYGATALASYEINEHFEAYARATFASTQVVQQVAPSGVFGNTFWTPLSNPLISAPSQAAIITAAETQRGGGTVYEDTFGPLPGGNWRDLDNSGTVTAGDDLLISYRRRTVELGPRSTQLDQDYFQLVAGLRGDIAGGWTYDANIARGQVNRLDINRGYTNLSNIEQQVYSLDGVTCANTSDPSCVPIDLFGGTITPAMGAYSSATAMLARSYAQTIFTATANGPLPGMQSPWASNPVAAAVGFEYRHEEGDFTPDECLKLAPTSCLGGAGGNTLPIAGEFDVSEVFAEVFIPLLEDAPFARSLEVELGYRTSDFSVQGNVETYKYGLSWEPIDGLRFRAMQQRAARAPNIGELFAPVTTSLDNAAFDPCSLGNPDPISPALAALCVSTGMLPAQVGLVQDIVSGQINTFSGSNPLALPGPEIADTLTVGMVFRPNLGDFIRNPTLTLDYYDIDIQDYVGTYSAQEVLDNCYINADVNFCNLIQRVGGDLVLPGSGIETFTTNLLYRRAEGLELSASFGLDFDTMGALTFQFVANHYLTNERQSTAASEVIESVGFFGTSAGGPLPETRWIQRTTWDIGDFQFSYLWRHFGEVESEIPIFPAFQTIDAYNWLDLTAAWNVNDTVRLSAGVTNVTDEDPPVVGNEAAGTAFNNGNTFPAFYDTLGRVFSVGVNMRF